MGTDATATTDPEVLKKLDGVVLNGAVIGTTSVSNAVATIGDQSFTSLEEAINAANGMTNGATITLTDKISGSTELPTITKNVVILGSSSNTITINVPASISTSTYTHAIEVGTGATLTIKNATINITGVQSQGTDGINVRGKLFLTIQMLRSKLCELLLYL